MLTLSFFTTVVPIMTSSGMLKEETRPLFLDKLASDASGAHACPLGPDLVERSTIQLPWTAFIKQHRTWPRTTFASTAD
jgi:hypothetical protein